MTPNAVLSDRAATEKSSGRNRYFREVRLNEGMGMDSSRRGAGTTEEPGQARLLRCAGGHQRQAGLGGEVVLEECEQAAAVDVHVAGRGGHRGWRP